MSHFLVIASIWSLWSNSVISRSTLVEVSSTIDVARGLFFLHRLAGSDSAILSCLIMTVVEPLSAFLMLISGFFQLLDRFAFIQCMAGCS